MADRAQYATTPRYEVAVASVANTGFDGSGTIVPLFTAGPNGSRIDAIGVAAQGATTEGRLCFYFRASSADTWRWFFAFIVEANASPGATNPPWANGVTNQGIILGPGAQMGFAPTKNETFAAHVTSAGNF